MIVQMDTVLRFHGGICDFICIRLEEAMVSGDKVVVDGDVRIVVHIHTSQALPTLQLEHHDPKMMYQRKHTDIESGCQNVGRISISDNSTLKADSLDKT